MPKLEERQIGNFDPREIHEKFNAFGEIDLTAPSLYEQWQAQGITFELSDPIPTDTHTVAQLGEMGLRSVTIYVPVE